MTLDVCLNCRIQATHREGRGQCPRCRGPLLEVDAQTRQPVNRGPAPQSARPGPPASAGPSAPVRTTTQAAPVQRPPAQPRPAVRQPAAQSRPAQPQQSAQLQSAQPQSAQPQRAVPPQSLAARGYPAGRPSAPVNRPQLRWWAHRPVDTIPARPAPPRAAQPRPRYQYMPRWGLPDLRPTAEPNVDGAEGATRRIDWRDLGQSLRLLGAVLAGAALMQLLRYLLVVVNRNRPIPEWLDKLSLISVLVFGCLAVAGALVVLVAFTRWLRDLREADYRRIDRHEPRPAWQLIPGAVIPFVNVVTAPFLLLESTCTRPERAAAQARRRIERLAVAWALVNLVGLIALVYRFFAWRSESIQTGADAMVWVILSFAVSAAFAYWSVPRLAALTEIDATVPVPERRLVAV